MEEYCIRASVFEEYCSEYLSEAFRLAEEALASGEVPVGCILVNGQRVIASGRNAANECKNGTRHAEIVAFDQAVRWFESQETSAAFDLTKAYLYVTSEPCMMCAAAICQLKVGTLVYGCRNERFGGFGSVVHVQNVFGYQYPIEVYADVCRDRAIALLQSFYEGENPNAPIGCVKRKRKLPGKDSE
uniref:tRNA-specific adenosine deaminase 2 n=1 Tax=Trichuris muris TaxID=70415 RepID=A0A5S6R4S2_TRIMR